MSEITAAEKLTVLRQSLGLTQKRLAELISVSEASVRRFEHTHAITFRSKNGKKILSFIEEHAHKDPKEDENEDWITRAVQKLKEDEARRKTMTHIFIAGKPYFISDANSNQGCGGDISPTTGRGCIFVYIRKDGRHHIFRELRGGWTRTYTDVQLIGKKIKECESQ